MYGDPAVREAIPGLLSELGSDRRMRRVISDRLEAAARTDLAARVRRAVRDQVAREGIGADTLMDVIAGGAWYAVCVRHVGDTERAAEQLSALVLHGILR